MKFSVEGILLTHGAYSFETPQEAALSPLAAKLFHFEYVSRVFISKNFVTITKRSEENPLWEQVMVDLRIVIKKHLEAGEPLFDFDTSADREEPQYTSDVAGQLHQLLDDRIRMATNEDGGDITFGSYENGILKVNLAGACMECPFAPRTIKAGIEKLVMAQFPEVVEVTSDQVDWSDTQQEG
jgi:Fe-S cluster biogenesis protein NfuA